MNNKLFIELLGPAAAAQAYAIIVPVTGELTVPHMEGFACVLRNIRIREGVVGSVVFLDEVPNRTDSEQSNSFLLKKTVNTVSKYHTEQGWRHLFFHQEVFIKF